MNDCCPICASGKLQAIFDGARDWEYGVKGLFDFKCCVNCGFLILSPMPSIEQLRLFYPSSYHGFHTSDAGLVTLLYRVVYYFRFREYKRLIGNGRRLLDIGCADAPYFDLLKKSFSEIDSTGIEFKDEIAEKGRKLGRKIITGVLADFDDTEKFDLIIMNNLIEHVVDPIEELKKAHSLLKSGGYIFLETPNTDSLDFHIAKKYWGGLHVPRHTCIFSRTSLGILAEKTGFSIKSVKFLLNTDHWALSVQNFLQGYSMSQCHLNNGRAWYYKLLLIVFIPLNFLQMLMGKTGSMTAILKKA